MKHLPSLSGMVTVCGVPNCFDPQKRVIGEAPAFRTLAEIKAEVCRMAKVPGFWSAGGTLLWNHKVIPQAFWDKITAAPGDRIDFVAAPAGKVGNMLLKIVGAIAMTVAAYFIPGAQGLAVYGWGALFAGGMALTMFADKIAPLPMPSLGLNQNDKRASPTYSLNGSSNQMRYGQPIPRIYGRYRVPPARILDDYTELAGQEEYLNFVGVIGYGPLEIKYGSVRIGDNDLDNYGIEIYDPAKDQDEGVIQITEGVLGPNGKPVQQEVIDHVAFQNSFQEKLETRDAQGNKIKDHAQWWLYQTLGYTVTSLSFDLQAPQGIYHMNDEAERESRSVEVEMQYRKIRDADGQEISKPKWVSQTGQIKAAAQAREAYLFFKDAGVAVKRGKSCYVELKGGKWVGTATYSSASVCKLVASEHYDNAQETTVTDIGLAKVYSEHLTAIGATGTVTIKSAPSCMSVVKLPAYTYTGAKTYTLTGIKTAPANPIRKTFTIKKLEAGTYEVRIRRKKLQSNDTKDVGDVYWTALRGFNKSERLYTGKKPVAMIGMRIKATNQLNGNLPVVTMLATSKLRDWNGKKWVVRATRNPASIFLDILTGAANERPKPDSQIDFKSLQAWHEWCAEYGYTCDMVFDTQTNVWDALCQVCACGRGSPNLSGGKWGVVWAHRQTDIVGHITARNTRGFSSSKTYLSELHGLHVTFQDEENDYEDTVIDVYAKGYKRSNASLFEGIELNGITSEKQAAYMGHFRLNQTLLLPEQYSVTMPLEYMRLHKNDLVRVVRDEIGYGIGAASLVSFTENASHKITALTFDAPLAMTPGKKYVAVIRLGSGAELACSGSAEDGMNFELDTPVSYTVAPRPMDLVMVGTTQTVGRTCIVTSIKPQEGLTAQVTLMDYVDELYENDGGPVPAYDPCLTIAGKLGQKLKTPTINLVRHDEWALSDTGQPRLYVRWKYNDKSVSAHVEYRRVQSGLAEAWMDGGNVINANDIYISPIDESWTVVNGEKYENGITYDVRVQAIDTNTGVCSSWALQQGIQIIGRTTYPPDLASVVLALKAPLGIMLSWTRLTQRDIVYYQVTGSIAGTSATDSIILEPWEMVGALEFGVVAVDALGLKSRHPAMAYVTIYAPQAPEFRRAELLDEGIVAEYAAEEGSWPIEQYELSIGNDLDAAVEKSVTTQDRMMTIPVPTTRLADGSIVKFDIGKKIRSRARDIFRNWGGYSPGRVITIWYPKTPKVRLSATKDTGGLILEWDDCQNDHDGAPRIDHYAISGTLTTAQKQHAEERVKSTRYESRVPLTAYEWGAQTIDGIEIMVGTVSVNVEAVDRYGISNKDDPSYVDSTVQLTILPPYNPVDMSIEADAENGSVILRWQDCERTFAIDYYLVTDNATGQSYKSPANYLAVPPRDAESYSFTVQAFDVLGQSSAAMPYSPVIRAPLAPDVEEPEIIATGVRLNWTARYEAGCLPVIAWDIIRQWDETREGGGVETMEMDYGRIDASTITVPAFPVANGEHSFLVRAVDDGGNAGAWAEVILTVKAPGRVNITQASVIDNNVNIYWEMPQERGGAKNLWFPVKEYLFDAIEDGYPMRVATVDALFAYTHENIAGEYTYAITPVDTGGNAGQASTVTVTVQQPPDYVFYHDYDSLFNGGNCDMGRGQQNGGRTNFVLDGRGHMLGPVPDDETWEENLIRMNT